MFLQILVELQLLFQSENIDLSQIEPRPIDALNELDSSNQILSVNAGSPSGGYAYQILSKAARELLSLSSPEVEFKSATRFVPLPSNPLIASYEFVKSSNDLFRF